MPRGVESTVYEGSSAPGTLGRLAGREYVPGVGANHRQEESIRAYTGSGSQSQAGREYIPGVGANHRHGESI
eukprot:3302253-Pyramimonas_sp.AAC.1